MKTFARIFFALVTGASLAIAYAQPGPYTPYYPPPPSDRVEYGVVENIEVYPGGGQPHNPINLGTVIGGVAGGVIGHQFGSGRGNTAATIAGAGVGAVVGNEVDKTRQREPDRYRIVVRLDSGAALALTEVGEGEFHIGDRVRVVNNRIYRG